MRYFFLTFVRDREDDEDRDELDRDELERDDRLEREAEDVRLRPDELEDRDDTEERLREGVVVRAVGARPRLE